MADKFFLYNNYGKNYVSLDPTDNNFGLRTASSIDKPLPFTFKPVDNYVNICTDVNSKPLCLDVYGDDKKKVLLSEAGSYSGQMWNMTQFNAGFKLSNAYSGGDLFLDIYSDSRQVFMSGKDFQGQYWKQVPANGDVASNGAAPSNTAAPGSITRSTLVATPLSAPTSSSPSQTADSQPQRPSTLLTATSPTSTSEVVIPSSVLQSTKPGLSTGTKAGIGAGSAFLALAFIAIIIGVLFRRRKAKRNDAVQLPSGDEKHRSAHGSFGPQSRQSSEPPVELASPLLPGSRGSGFESWSVHSQAPPPVYEAADMKGEAHHTFVHELPVSDAGDGAFQTKAK